MDPKEDPNSTLYAHCEDDRYFSDDEYVKLLDVAKANGWDNRVATAQAALIRLHNRQLTIDEIIVIMSTKETIPWIYPLESPGKIMVHTGDVYQFQMPVSTRAGVTYNHGDLLLVQKQTKDTPHGEIGPYGYNWLCVTHANTTVWATLESCIERGYLRRIYPTEA